jgi:hypothetical protein
MSHISYNFLADSILFHKKSIATNFAGEDIKKIEKELLEYRNHILSQMVALQNEIAENKSSLSVFSTKGDTPIRMIKQTALYMDQYVISDPLFRFTNLETESERAMSSHLGFKEGINLQSLSKAAIYLKELTPMVAGKYLKVFPADYHFEAQKPLKIKIPINNNNDLLPKDLRDFFDDRCQVSPMSKLKNEEGWAILPGKELKPCRAINIEFEGDNFSNGSLYFLYQQKIISYDQKTRIAKVIQTMPETPPSQEEFDTWVLQSKNSVAKSYFDKTFSEAFLAEKLGSRLICENDLKNDLLSKHLQTTEEDIKGFTANQMLNIDLPFLEQIDTQKLMDVREFEADIFTNFRVELEKQFREIRTIKDPKDVKLKTENIFHELNEVQGQKISMRLSHIKKQMAVNTALSIGGLIGSMTVGLPSLAATAVALAKGYKDFKDYTVHIKENPAYFLWKTKNHKRPI